MKRNLFFLVLIHLIMTALFAVCGYALITDVYENEIDTVKQIAGSVLAEYPEAETVLISSLEKDDADAEAYGGERIARYGYHGADSFRGSFRYEESLRKLAGLLGLSFLLLLLHPIKYLIIPFYNSNCFYHIISGTKKTELISTIFDSIYDKLCFIIICTTSFV